MSSDDTEIEGSSTDEEAYQDDDNDSDYEVGKERLTLKAKKIKRSNGKWTLFNDDKKFQKQFEDLFPWVEEDPEDPHFAICRACDKRLRANENVLKKHQKTKNHLKCLSGCDDIEDDEPKRAELPRISKTMSLPPPPLPQLPQANMEQLLSEDQFNFLGESQMDQAHQALTDLIDKLVEKYNDEKVASLRIQQELLYRLSVQKSNVERLEKQKKMERNLQQEQYAREIQEMKEKFLQEEHEARIAAMEQERDAKLKAVEQQLMYARQEYEKKVKLLDQQLQFIK